MNKVYVCIDLKSFYASVECVLRKLDPLNTNLVVADESRTSKTVCLAITPSLKQYGLGGRARLFEVERKIREVNYKRKKDNNYKDFSGKSFIDSKLKMDKSLELDYIIATPQMKKYMKYSLLIYNIYLKYLAPEDIFVYSIDEVFCDITNYLHTYNLTPRKLVTKMIKDVYDTTKITATAGIGSNMYLAKVSMDIVAKREEADEIGVRIALLQELGYRRLLWNHRPLTDFWRVGRGIAKTLERYNMYTMGDIARCSIQNEDLLYKLLGVNAEILIDHAWGYEPTTIKEIKEYKPKKNSISSGQVLHSPYNYEKTKLIVKEMVELLSLDLVDKGLLTNQIILTIGYDIENLTNPKIRDRYFGEITTDNYGREVPKHAHGTINIKYQTSSTKVLLRKAIELFEEIINRDLLVRRVNVCFSNVVSEEDAKNDIVYEQLDLFSSTSEKVLEEEKERKSQNEEKRLQQVLLDIKNKYGKNAIFRGMNLEEGAMTIERNNQVGGHKG